jgi:hypothetical protein
VADYIVTGNKRHFPESSYGATRIESAGDCSTGSRWKSGGSSVGGRALGKSVIMINPEGAGATVSGPFRSVWRYEQCVVGELPDGIGDPAPGHRAVIAFGRELACTRGALLERVLTVTLEHQGGGAPDVDLGYHAETVCKPAV